MNQIFGRRSLLLSSSTIALCLAMSSVAFSADRTWDGTTDSDWFVAGNWVGDTLPGSGDNVKITDPTVPVPNYPVLSTNAVDLGTGGVTVDAGTLTINNGGTLTSDGLVAGAAGTGTLLIENSGGVSSNASLVGQFAPGTVTVTGMNSTWTTTSLTVGFQDTGTLTIADGGLVSSTQAIIGYQGFPGFGVVGDGTVTVTGTGSTWASSGDLVLGFLAGGIGTLTISNGGVVNVAGNTTIGRSAGATGTVTVTGAGSTWTNSGNLTVGENGTGTLIIENGGAVSNTKGIIGSQLGSTGTVTVTGAGSKWTNSDTLILGDLGTGTGTLLIENGGSVSNSSGVLGVDGTGTVTVTGMNSTWTNTAGLTVGQFGTGTLTIADGGKVSNVDGTIGGFFADADGKVTVTGTGSTWTNTGDLRVSFGNSNTIDNGTGTLTIADGGVVNVAGNTTIAQSAGSTGTLNIGSAAGDAPVAPGTFSSSSLAFGDGDGRLTFNHTDLSKNYSFDPAISGNGKIDHLAGYTTLTGDSSGFTGTTTVDGGTLAIQNKLGGDVSVMSGGTLGGSGILTGDLLVRSGATVAPGMSIGTLTVNGNYEQQSTGTLDIEIKPDGSDNDLLVVGGTAQLAGTLTAQGENGALLTPGVGGTATSPQVYTILTASGGVSGQFDTDPAPLGAFTFDTTYNADNVQLGVIYAGFTPIQTGAALTPPGTTPVTIPGTGTTNQVSKANALDKAPVVNTGFSSGNTDFDKILLEIANETPDQLAATYNAIIAEPYAAFMTVLLEQNDFYAETVLERAQLCSARGRGSLAGGYSPQQAAGGEPLTAGCPNHERHGVWLDATWLQGSIDGDDGLSGYDYRLAGAVLGVDTAVGTDATVGAAFGYGQPKLNNYDLADAEIDGNSYHLSTYGTLTRNRWEFFGLLGYTWGSYDSERNIRFGSINRTARGNFDGDGFIASAKAAYDYPVTGYDLIPEFGITYSKIWQDGFTEKGADSLNLRVNDADAHSLITSLGVRVGTEFQSGKTSIRPQALLRYEYDWNASDDDAHDIVSSFASVPSLGSIDIIGRNRGEHGLLLAGGVTAQASENTNLFAGAGYRWNSNGEEYNFGVGARIAW